MQLPALMHIILATLALISGACASRCSTAAVYDFCLSPSALTLAPSDALLVWADALGASSRLSIGSAANQESVFALLDEYHRGDRPQRPHLIITVQGALDALFSNTIKPSYHVDLSSMLYDSLESLLREKVPQFLVQDRQYRSVSLTRDVQLFTQFDESKSTLDLTRHFKHFQEKVLAVWKLFIGQHALMNGEILQSGLGSSNKLNLMLDKFYISELSQLVHLTHSAALANPSDVFTADLHGLFSVLKKTGADSATYALSNQVLGEMVQQLLQQYNVHVLVAPPPQCPSLSPRSQAHLMRRSRALDRNGHGTCYSLQESCDAATNLCSSHGKCVASGGNEQCWQCACVSTRNATSQRTTLWLGPACAQRDVAWQANLLLWLSLGLLVVVVAGIRLLASVGSEPLPGVLDMAATPLKT